MICTLVIAAAIVAAGYSLAQASRSAHGRDWGAVVSYAVAAVCLAAGALLILAVRH